MRILIAPDKFRGSLEAHEVCRAVEEGILLAFPDARVTSIPLADGGEGTTQILTEQSQGSYQSAQVEDPLGRSISASYGLSGDVNVAYIEMASASGLRLLTLQERNPLLTSTYGTGQIVISAIENGVKEIILGIGGSATTDGGIGMAAAVGYRFFDKGGNLLDPIGESLVKIDKIDCEHVDVRLRSVSITVACDVTNPLFGSQGAAYIYGPQKGANQKMVEELDLGLRNLAAVSAKKFGRDVSDQPGAGAAGGLGAGCLWFLNATLKEGVQIVMDKTNLAEHIKNSDLVITGEGKVDEQTLSGKVVKGLAGLCQKFDVPLAVVCGTLMITPEETRAAGITFAVSVLNKPMDLVHAQKNAHILVKEATFNLVRLFFSSKL